MKFVARVVAIMLFGALVLKPAFADEAAKASANQTNSEASAPNAATIPSTQSYIDPSIPIPPPSRCPKGVCATLISLNTGLNDFTGNDNSTGYLAPTIPVPPMQTAKTTPSIPIPPPTPAVDLFVGYSYVRFNTNAGTSENFSWHGVTGALAGNINRWFSLVGDFGGYRLKDLPPGVTASAYTYLFGPQFSHRGERWTPFVHALFGAARLADVQVTTLPNGSSFFNRSFSQNAFATALGGGIDLNLNRHVGFRLAQIEYLMTHFTDGNDNRQNNIRASTGLVLHFGGNPPPPPPNHPPTVTVSANPTKVNAGSGDSIVLKADAADPDNDTLSYKWSATGGGIEGNGSEVRWNSNGVNEGSYTATVTVDDGKGGTANASAEMRVEPKPNTPPVISSCTANPATITVGQRSNIAVNASDADNDKLAYSYKSTGGNVSGDGANAQFDSTGVAPGNYTVTCHVSDGRGGETDATTQVTVQPAAPPKEQVQLEQRLSLHSIYFATAKPTVINPTGGLVASQERTLTALATDFKNYLRFKPEAHLILQGHADPRGGEEYNKALSERRVARTKAFLVEQGVKADAIDTQGLGEEQPMSAAQVKQAVDQEQDLSAAQKAQLSRNANVLALAQSRRVDVTLSTTGQTSVRQFPFNAEDALNLINPKGTGTAKPGTKGGTAKAGTSKAGASKTGTSKAGTKKAPPKK
jgi:outer membrane protein OmpA-like peptidoglycan-associated protein